MKKQGIQRMILLIVKLFSNFKCFSLDLKSLSGYLMGDIAYTELYVILFFKMK